MNDLHLQRLLADVPKAGVYHLPHLDKQRIVAAARERDLAVFRVNLSKVTDKEMLLSSISKALHFPDWFGHNFDGLADCLADLEWLPPADGYLIMLEHCDGIHDRAEGDFVTMLKVFEQAADEWRDEGIPFWCLVEMQSDGIAWFPTEL